MSEESRTLRFTGKSRSKFGEGQIRWDFIKDVAARLAAGCGIDLLDLTEAVHMKPYIVALCLAACARLKTSQFRVAWPRDPEVRDYLARMELAQALDVGDALTSESRGTSVPARLIRDRPEPGFAYSLVALLERQFDGDLPPGEVPGISGNIDEVITNALTHAESTIGCVVLAQAYPYKGRIDAVILDLGITIRGHLSRKYNAFSEDGEAILEAVKDGVTGTVDVNRFGDPNSGAGLFCLKEYVEQRGGELAILSGNALVTFGARECLQLLGGQRFAGTLINIKFRTCSKSPN